ncbi:MAG: lysylphosphatidylglycerol synthase transmembrane domain-containing protein [archaeon]
MKPQTKKILQIGLLIIIVILAGIYVKNNISDFKKLEIINPFYFVILLILFLINYVIIGEISKKSIQVFNINLSNVETFWLSIANGFYNLITPLRGGIASRAIYLKKKYKLSYTEFLGTVVATSLAIVFASGILGLIAIITIYFQTKIFGTILFIIFLGMTILSTLVILFSPKFKETKIGFLNRFVKLLNAWHSIRKNKKMILIILILTTIQILISSLALKYQFLVFGVEIDFIKAMMLSSIAGASIVISLTPANLGISEAITIFSAQTIGISPVYSLSASLIGRVLQFVVLFILGPIASYKLIKTGKKK